MKAHLAAGLFFLSAQSLACGVCIDDKVASCYDHAVVTQAKARGHEVAFFAIEGGLPVNAQVRSQVLGAVQGARGVLRDSARVSLENAALSFAYDPQRATRTAIVSGIDRRLAARGLSLRYLRSMP